MNNTIIKVQEDGTILKTDMRRTILRSEDMLNELSRIEYQKKTVLDNMRRFKEEYESLCKVQEEIKSAVTEFADNEDILNFVKSIE